MFNYTPIIDFEPKTQYGQIAKKIAGTELKQLAREADAKDGFIPRTLELLKEHNIIAPTIPKEFGGLGITEIESLELIEQVTKYNTSAASMITCQLMAANAFIAGASEEQKKEYLQKMSDGSIIGVPAITEESAGSDVAAIQCTAVKDGDDYVITGEKTLISFLGLADIYIVFAKTDVNAGYKGITAFIVEKDNPNLTMKENFKKMGQKGMPTGTITLNGCRVHKSKMIGEEGAGFKVCMELLNRSRITVAAQSVGVAIAGYEAAIEYSAKRKTFGKPLHSHQAIAFKLADMTIKLHTARLAAFHAAEKYDNGENYLTEVSIAKVYASEISREIVNESLQIHGGIGYTSNYDIERLYRDQRITELYGGSSEIQRIILSKEIIKNIQAD